LECKSSDEDKMIIDTSFFVQQILLGKKLKVLQSPGARNTFIVDELSPLLDEQK
jgi:hypothetical protein